MLYYAAKEEFILQLPLSTEIEEFEIGGRKKVESEEENIDSRNSQTAEVLQTFRRAYRYRGSAYIVEGSESEDEGYGFSDTSGSEPFRRFRAAGIRI